MLYQEEIVSINSQGCNLRKQTIELVTQSIKDLLLFECERASERFLPVTTDTLTI